MINGLEGIPGSGKSYEACAFHVLPALKAGRKVITNLPLIVEKFAVLDPSYVDLIELRTRPTPIRGTWNGNPIAGEPSFKLFDDRHVEEPDSSVAVFGHVWDFWTEWRRDDGIGPLFVIDEAHIPFPQMRFGKTDRQVVEWFKLHRHFNADVLLMTQSFRDIEPSIASLIATLIKCREASIIGKAGCYIRKVHAGYRGAVIQKSERKYDAKYFGLYKSHTQGLSVKEQGAQDVDPFLNKFKHVQRITILIVLATLVWAYLRLNKEKEPEPIHQPAQLITQNAPPKLSDAVYSPSLPAQAQPLPDESIPAPPKSVGVFDHHNLHITGLISRKDRTLTAFVVSDGSRKLFEANSDDMANAGYQWQQLTPCAGWLKFGESGTPRAVTCDQPMLNEGSQGRPIVVNSATGARSGA